MKIMNLGEDQAIVMQTIDEYGEEDVEDLVETLRYDRPQLMHILRNLQHKGLVIIRSTNYGSFARLSAKGHKALSAIWPEIPYIQYS